MDWAAVSNIQKFSLHDGPGIRSTVFLLGCPLRCAWCHNPETWSCTPGLVFTPERCISCGACIEVCPTDALSFADGGINRDLSRCILCGACADACPALAFERAGREMSLDEVWAEVIKDKPFYDLSRGGVTVSGGEPLVQGEFAFSLLSRCKANGIHTAVDTSGYGDWEVLKKLASVTDLFLYDVKLLDDRLHRRYTGVSNVRILENLKRLREITDQIWLRLPILPGINDGTGQIAQIGELAKSLALTHLFLLPYHNIGQSKYARLRIDYPLSSLSAPSDERMAELRDLLSDMGLCAQIGG